MIRIMSALADALQAALSPPDIVEIALIPDQRLFRQDDVTEGLFFLEGGRIDLVRYTASGTLARIHAAKPGETFAEASLFATRYHCDAVATLPSYVRRLAKRPVLARLETDSSLSRAFAVHLAASLRQTRRRMELLFVNPLSERLHLRLEELADEGGQLPPDISIKSVAEEIGATPEATYRALAQLERSGRVARPARATVRLLRTDSASCK